MKTKYRPTIFIASSGQAKEIAEAVKIHFDQDADVDVWTDNIFKLNRGTLETLLNRASYYDFCIAVFAADDVSITKGEEKKTTRDNVIFEFGLFLGRIGLNRTFFLLEEGADIFSDWNGITRTEFRRRGNLAAAVGSACSKIKEEMKVVERLFDFTVLPSTSLALGYYNNFLKPVLEALQHEDKFEVVEKDSNGRVIQKFEQEIKDHFPTIEIRVPKNLAILEREKLKYQTKGLKQITLHTRVRSFPFYVQGDFKKDSTMDLFDIPTTLFASYLTIDKFFSPDFLARENNLQKLMDKEIRNFEKTLGKLIPDDIEHKYFSFSVF